MTCGSAIAAFVEAFAAFTGAFSAAFTGAAVAAVFCAGLAAICALGSGLAWALGAAFSGLALTGAAGFLADCLLAMAGLAWDWKPRA